MKTLFLTSPNVKGKEVIEVQKILKNLTYYNGKLDGIYGEQTAAATKAAKWDIGYAKKNVTNAFGSLLLAFITGVRKPTILMRRRASIRRNKKTLGVAALEVGLAYIGTSEKPSGSNKVMFSEWYGMVGPWCAMFVTYCFVRVNSKTFVKGSKYAYCPYMLADARAQRNGLRVVSKQDAASGDLVLFDFKHNGVPGHIGIVNTPPGNKKFFTSVEGNTSGTNPSDGGMVALMERAVSDVIAFVRVVN